MTDVENATAQAARLLVEAGEPVAGSMARSAAGILFDPGSSRVRIDPHLAAVLARVATAAEDLGSSRERVRAGAMLAFAVELAVTRTAQGRSARSDGFLPVEGRDRVAVDELAELIGLAARHSADERRVRHLGYLLTEVLVSPDVDLPLAGRALSLVEAVSWRQLALLAGVGRRERIPLPIAPLPDEAGSWAVWGACEDVTELQRSGLLDPPMAGARPGGAALPRLRPADLRLTRRGVLLHRLLTLDLLHDDAVAAALADLGLPRS